MTEQGDTLVTYFFNGLDEAQIREACRIRIELLEMWLRRLITDQVTTNFGPDFVDTPDTHGNFLFSKECRKKIANRLINEPERYPRKINAALISELMKVFCESNKYRKYFREAFKDEFLNAEHLRLILDRLPDPRNKLSHANAISIRQAEQCVCYVNDVIDTLKGYYKRMNMHQDYDSPFITRMWDSLGNEVFAAPKVVKTRTVPLYENEEKGVLRPGDMLTIEIDIDPTYPLDECEIEWTLESSKGGHTVKNKKILEVPITNNEVMEIWTVTCRVASTTKGYNRFGRWAESWAIQYQVKRPI